MDWKRYTTFVTQIPPMAMFSVVWSSITVSVMGRIMPPKDVHVLIPRTCEYVTLHGKMNYADMIHLMTLRWGDYYGLPMWAQVYNMTP